jgi:hypothetical protein
MAINTNSKLSVQSFFFEPTGHGGWQLKWDVYQALAIFAGVIMLLIYGWRNGGWLTFAVCVLIAAVALAAGLLLGFLFGIPKDAQAEPPKPQTAQQQPVGQQGAQAQVGQQPGGTQPGAPAQGGQQQAAQPTAQTTQSNQPKSLPPKPTLKANTNLVEISDWLTKMIVGVGLYQLSTLPGKLKSLAGYFSTAFGAQATPPALVMAILGYFGIFGFLLGYLWARIYLTKEFEPDGDDGNSQAQPQPQP